MRTRSDRRQLGKPKGDAAHSRDKPSCLRNPSSEFRSTTDECGILCHAKQIIPAVNVRKTRFHCADPDFFLIVNPPPDETSADALRSAAIGIPGSGANYIYGKMTDWENRAHTMSIREFTPSLTAYGVQPATTDDGRGSRRARVHQWTDAGKRLKKCHSVPRFSSPGAALGRQGSLGKSFLDRSIGTGVCLAGRSRKPVAH